MQDLYIGFDRDGTIDLPHLPAPAELGEQLRIVQREGAQLFIASGKSYAFLTQVCAQLRIAPWMYCCENGGHIVIPSERIEQVHRGDDSLEHFIAAAARLNLPPCEDEPKHSIWSKRFGAGAPAAKALIDAYVAQHGLNLDVFAYPDGAVDVVPAGIDKANALAFIPRSATVHFFGDGDNDLGIMRHPSVIPHTVCNGRAIVKACVAAKGGQVSELPAGHGVATLLKSLRETWAPAYA
jgi:hydroxymethylpyrimidine pyrophosphatase-like HAD family hydrolase